MFNFFLTETIVFLSSVFICSHQIFDSLLFYHLGFLSQVFTNHRTAGEGGGHFFTSHYHFHAFHTHLDISWTIIAEWSPLHIGSSRTRTKNFWFPSSCRQPLSYAPCDRLFHGVHIIT